MGSPWQSSRKISCCPHLWASRQAHVFVARTIKMCFIPAYTLKITHHTRTLNHGQYRVFHSLPCYIHIFPFVLRSRRECSAVVHLKDPAATTTNRESRARRVGSADLFLTGKKSFLHFSTANCFTDRFGSTSHFYNQSPATVYHVRHLSIHPLSLTAAVVGDCWRCHSDAGTFAGNDHQCYWFRFQVRWIGTYHEMDCERECCGYRHGGEVSYHCRYFFKEATSNVPIMDFYGEI